MDSLRLQQVLYIIQETFYKQFNRPCFEGKFKEWNGLAFEKESYKEFKKYGGSSIPNCYNEQGQLYNLNFMEEWNKALVEKIIDDTSRISLGALIDRNKISRKEILKEHPILLN